MKPIDGHAMIARVEALYRRGAVDMSYYNIVKEAVQMEPTLEIVRTSDRVNVTSCRNCKYGKLCFDANGQGLIQCTNPYYPAAFAETWPFDLDWYCAGGERRDDDATLD